MPDHWFSMCNQCICEPKCWGDVTNVHAQKHFHTVPWTLGRRLCLPPTGSVKSQIIWRLLRDPNWSPESTGFANSLLSSQWGETVDLTFFFPRFCSVLFLRLCVSMYSNQTNVSWCQHKSPDLCCLFRVVIKTSLTPSLINSCLEQCGSCLE